MECDFSGEEKSANNTVTIGTQESVEVLQESNTFRAETSVIKSKNLNEDRYKIRKKHVQNCTRGSRKCSPFYRRRHRKGIILPTKFLLGGNINDPLNLNSMQDEEVNKTLNAVTPTSSPLPTPTHRIQNVEVLIPPNAEDPLSLMDCRDDTKYEQKLTSHNMSVRNKQDGMMPQLECDEISKDTSENKSVESMPISDGDPKVGGDIGRISTAPGQSDNKILGNKNSMHYESGMKRSIETSGDDTGASANGKKKKSNPIVSPVVPQPGSWRRQPNVRSGFQPRRYSTSRSEKGQKQQVPNFRTKNARFQYGNYSRYYGYRNPAHEVDPRLKCFAERREIFQNKDVLDIGCNIGHITLTVARDFNAKSVVGLDIDRSLIDIAKKNVKHYVKCAEPSPSDHRPSSSKSFPISMSILYGEVNFGNLNGSSSRRASFPDNVSFVQGNYVLETDDLLSTERAQFDVILCLSLTKWIHLNWGDVGLKRAFKRMYVQLRQGGTLILEVQPLESYKRKKTLTETIYKNFNSMEFMPEQFIHYLLSSEVGFTNCETIGTPQHKSKGFQRPIHILTKGELSPSQFAESGELSHVSSLCSTGKNDVQGKTIESSKIAK